MFGIIRCFLSLAFFCHAGSSSLAHTSLYLSLPPTTSSSTYETSQPEERTFVALKPDTIQRNLMGEIISRLENKGLKVVALKLIRPTQELITEHYSDHKDQHFFKDILDFFLSGPIVIMALEGNNAIHVVRKLIGSTQPEDAEAGTIRGDYCFGKGRNLVHASDTIENAKRELHLWFKDEEILCYRKIIDQWVILKDPSLL
jgi:nucleoside-diphosphate kinase|mmetsp:Transcript_27606/g.26419  ORF Transcript_27606/g.26419 Transcript_27606/m.26419 type:complete len:201 (-) Transcript_27606:1768-2370(-)